MVVVVSVGLGLWLGVVGAALVGCVGVSDWSVSVLGWVRIGGSASPCAWPRSKRRRSGLSFPRVGGHRA
jgi:hypothetical protein